MEKRFNLPCYILCALFAFSLAACSKTLDSEKIAQTIQQDIIKQGGINLKTVTCPKGIEPKANETFECVGGMDTGYTFTIPVKQKDDQGSVTWDVPNTKGMLNLAKFETGIQEAIQAEVGSRPIIRCGGDGFKAVKAGQTFECKVDVKDTPKPVKSTPPNRATNAPPTPTASTKPKQPDKIVVAIDADGNVNWQRVVPGGVSQLLPKPAVAQTPPQAAPSPLPAQKSAEDFLNQPGSSDQFQD